MHATALLRAAALPAALVLHAAAGRAQTPAVANPFANPGEYSFAPPPSLALPPDPIPEPHGDPTIEPHGEPTIEPHGVVTSAVGNRGAGGSAALESALPGAGNTHVFVAAGGGEETPWRHGPTVTSRDVSAGIATVLPDDTAITLELDAGRNDWSHR